jgi:hypothetical protein
MMIAVEGKRLSLLHEVVPDANRIGVLFNPNSPDASSHLADIEAVGQSLGLELVIIKVADKAAYENAFVLINEQQIRALLVAADPLFLTADTGGLIGADWRQKAGSRGISALAFALGLHPSRLLQAHRAVMRNPPQKRRRASVLQQNHREVRFASDVGRLTALRTRTGRPVGRSASPPRSAPACRHIPRASAARDPWGWARRRGSVGR